MKKYISPSQLSGKVHIVASKSYMQRLLLAALISNSKCKLYNVPHSQDVISAVAYAKTLGYEISLNENFIQIDGFNLNKMDNVNCGESATILRMFLPFTIYLLKKFQVSGQGTLLDRIFFDLTNNLKKLNINCNSQADKLPLEISGDVVPGEYFIDGSHSSQFISGLLMIMPILHSNSILHVNNQVSKPYIDLTLSVLKLFDIEITNHNYTKYEIFGNQKFNTKEFYFSEGDWSSAANLLVAAAICGEIELEGLNINSCQADKEIINILENCNAQIEISDKLVKVVKSDLKSFNFDATNCPDLIPPLVALALNCNGTSTIQGIDRLENKESNRALALLSEFRKMGANINIENNKFYINYSKLKAGILDSHSDHRIAMSLTIAALNANGISEISGTQCVAKSFQSFFDVLNNLGAKIK